jgi:hypothetical protein
MAPEQQPLIVEHQDIRTINAHDTTDGTDQLIHAAIETVVVDPVTGTKRFEAKTTFIRTKDRRLIRDPGKEDVHACCDCRDAPFSAAGVVSCHRCARITCRRCARLDESGPHCKRCYRKLQWRKFWSWLFRLP